MTGMVTISSQCAQDYLGFKTENPASWGSPQSLSQVLNFDIFHLTLIKPLDQLPFCRDVGTWSTTP